ncbi:hypothetical protein [Ruegeria arenilitoris]|uniref:hypothetical protein n=1 Tax=Ruegeria arenilitoris TaxID=1173585 RepID=UPI00147DD364|nr:hypothetical protein [Ruegeria arenilitoris]
MQTEAISAVEVINMHLNRHYEADQRADAVVEMLLENEISSADFWPLLRGLWGGFEKIDHTMFVHAMDAEKRKSCWIPTEQWHRLPNEISVFRGQSLGKEVGLSWTINLDAALDYATRRRGSTAKIPIILETKIPKSAVAMVIENGELNELVLWRAPQISNCVVTQISSKTH